MSKQPQTVVTPGQMFMLPLREDPGNTADKEFLLAYEWLQDHPEEHPGILWEELEVRDIARCSRVALKPGWASRIMAHLGIASLATEAYAAAQYRQAVRDERQ